MSQVKFAFEAKFVSSLVGLPKEVPSKLVKCLTLLARDRNHPGLNDEPLKGLANGLRTARVDKNYRLLYEEHSELEIKLLLVAKHDETYREAERIRVSATPPARVAPKLVRPPLPALPSAFSAELATLIRLISPSGKKYLGLTNHLAEQPFDIRKVPLYFAEIITIISAELPKSAYLYSAWWANDKTHVQANAWLSVGWRTAKLELEERRVIFEREQDQL